MCEISVVIPVFNSEENLGLLVLQLSEALRSYDYEVILINDCSKDNSWEEIEKLSQQDEHLTGINLRRNFGQDGALMAGLNHVSGKYIVIMDDDLQHSPFDILKLYEEIKKGYDVCYANFNHKKQKYWKNLGGWINGKVAEVMINKPTNIYLSPFEIISREVVQEIIQYKGPYPYIQGLILSITQNVTQIPIEHHPRYKGKSNFNFSRSLKVFFNLFTSFSIVPLRFATYVGFITALAGFLLVPYYIYRFFVENYVISGWTTIIVLILVIGGLILLSLGLIGEYIGRMYLNINHRPQFIIKKIINRK